MSESPNESLKERFVYQPDLSAVSQLMLNTWTPPCWEYSPELLHSYLNKCEKSSSLSLGMYYDREIVGYLAYLPMIISHHLQQYPMVYATWWTASRKYFGRGNGMKLQQELLRASRSKGYMGVLTVTHANSHADKANRRIFTSLGESLNYIKTFSQMMTTPPMALRRLHEIDSFDVHPYDPSLRRDCVSLLNMPLGQVDIAQVVQENEVDYILQVCPIAHTWVYIKDERVKALVNIVEKKYIGEKSVLNAYIEHMVFKGLTNEECLQFWKGVLEDPYWTRITMICIPESNSISSEILFKMGFRRSLEKFNLYHVPFDSSTNFSEVYSFDLPVY